MPRKTTALKVKLPYTEVRAAPPYAHRRTPKRKDGDILSFLIKGVELHRLGRTCPRLQPKISAQDLDELAVEVGLFTTPGGSTNVYLKRYWGRMSTSQKLDRIATHILAEDRRAFKEEARLAGLSVNHQSPLGILSAWQYKSRLSFELLMGDFPVELHLTPSNRPEWRWTDGHDYHEAYVAAEKKHPPRLTGTKTCSCCGTDKPVAEFHINSRAKDGLQSECKECKKR